VSAAPSPHVLAISTDVANRALLHDLLEEDGFRVSTRPAVDQNLGALVALAPDLIVLDSLWTADGTVWQRLQRLRMDPRTIAIPIVLCTGAVTGVDLLTSPLAAMGVRPVLKPFNLDLLTGTIAETLDGRRPVPAFAGTVECVGACAPERTRHDRVV
jgi:CheY-like chemotaxis protein